MQIEKGKFYRTRDGRKVGPVVVDSCGFFRVDDIGHYTGDGLYAYRGELPRNDRDEAAGLARNDLVAEWTDGPVRTVTRKEIVPGVYGRIEISPHARTAVTHVGVRFEPMTDGFVALDADELRAAAATLTELADALSPTPGKEGADRSALSEKGRAEE